MIEQLEKIDKLVTGFADSTNKGTATERIDTLVSEMECYIEIMLPHLQHEEEQCLPLMRAYFEQHQFKILMMKLGARSPKVEMGSVVTVMGQERFRNEFMVQEGIPSIAWHLVLKDRVKCFERQFTNPINSLKNGDEPPVENRTCFC